MASNSGGASASSAQTIYQQNATQRALVIGQSLDMTQSIHNATLATLTPGALNVLTVVPRFVGLVKRFYIEVGVTITNTDGANALTLTPWGVANLLSQVVFTDLQNNQRIQTTGWHLATIQTAKAKFAAGGAFVNDNPTFNNSSFASGIAFAPATIAHSTAAIVTFLYEVPLAYTDDDLRGAVYMNTVNATAALQLTVNPAMIVATGSDPVGAVYTGNATYTLTNFTYNVYQNYLDQLPATSAGVVLPLLDISTIYELKNTIQFGLTVNQDFPIQFPNYRQFLSMVAIYDNAGVLNSGSDVNYWALQAANFTNIFKQDPYLTAYKSRKHLHNDMPKGGYYFDYRRAPLATQQYGNLEMVLNASAVTAGATVLYGFEDFAIQNVLTGAGSFPSS